MEISDVLVIICVVGISLCCLSVVIGVNASIEFKKECNNLCMEEFGEVVDEIEVGGTWPFTEMTLNYCTCTPKNVVVDKR